MRKATRNYIWFVIMSGLAAFEVASGFLLWLVIPRGGAGYMGGRGDGLATEGTLLGWSRQTWVSFHNWVGVVLLAIVVVHIVMHWGWIINMTKRLRRNSS